MNDTSTLKDRSGSASVPAQENVFQVSLTCLNQRTSDITVNKINEFHEKTCEKVVEAEKEPTPSSSGHPTGPQVKELVSSNNPVSREKPYYDLIIVVIANHVPLYDYFYTVWRRYDRVNPNIKVFYVYGLDPRSARPTQTGTDNIEDSIITTNSLEGFIPGILQKTIQAIEKIEKDYDYKYLLRTNLSSFFRLHKLHEYIMKLPATRLYEGFAGRSNDGIDFVSGAGIILSRDVVRLLIAEKYRLNYMIIDDVAIGLFMRTFGIPLRATYNRYDLVGAKRLRLSEDIIRILPHFHFRVRSPKKREIFDKLSMEMLYRVFYET